MATLHVPNPPAHLLKTLQAKWKEAYIAAHKQATLDIPENPSAQHTQALKAANQLGKVAEPVNHTEAAKLVEAFQTGGENGWKIIGHGARMIGGMLHLHIVTANGRKYAYPIPPEVAPAAPAKPIDTSATAAAAAAAAKNK
jgi:hypothetical protein